MAGHRDEISAANQRAAARLAKTPTAVAARYPSGGGHTEFVPITILRALRGR